jgi:dihydroorotate dehydrogenase
MKDTLVKIRNKFLGWKYAHFLKPIFFKMDPEFVHDRFTFMGRLLGSNPVTRGLTRVLFGYSHPMLEQTILGIHFKNPIGLSAGFDKDGLLTKIIPCTGFGYEEMGSITGEPCEGNPKPRLWRHPDKKALRVYYGLKNDGAVAIAKRLKKQRFAFPIGTSIAKTNCKETCETEAGIQDYAKAFTAFAHIGDYFTINISCPNAFGGQPFTDEDRLEKLLTALDQIPTQKPIFIKLSPDLTHSELDTIVDCASRYTVHGFISTNLTKKHDLGLGGLSGKAVEDLSNEQLKYLYKKTRGKFVLIGCGGIFTAKDAYEKIKAGASLLQLITGMIYQGPQSISEINRGLVHLLKKDGYSSLQAAIGKSVD